jgi:two-component system sensor histidine kinase KdpD
LRTTVLDALAHEYKSPLTTIRTATTGLIEMGDTSEAHSELIGLIDSETKRLTELTTRLLKTSRLDRTDVRIRPERIQVDELILGLLSVSESLTSGHDVKVVGLETGAYIRADRELVNMALTQLIDNAGKYSDPGSTITLAAQVSPGVVCISVHSIGPPIRKEDRERIFQRFYRAPGSNHKSAGTGIGLSITRKVAEAHKGRVWAVSHEAQGNTFFLELPRCTREEA